jgi:hypothetical protein
MTRPLLKCFVICACAIQGTAFATDTSYHLRNEIPIGGEGGWDILTIDPRRSGSTFRTRPKLWWWISPREQSPAKSPTTPAFMLSSPSLSWAADFPATARRRKRAWLT